MPCMLVSNFIFNARGSMAKRKRYGDNGSPCLQPHPKEKNCEKCPLFITVLQDSLYSTSNQCLKSLPKLYLSSTFLKYNQLTLSNAFSKSINSKRPDLFLLSNSNIISYTNLQFSLIHLFFKKPF